MDAVLFDLDDTLCAYRVSGEAVIERAFEAVGVEPCFDLADYHRVWDRHVGVSDGIRDLRRRCFTELVEASGHDRELAVELEAAYHARRDPTDVEALPGAREAVESLGTDHRLGLVTNGHPEVQRPKLVATGLDAHFETAVYGGYEVPAKPAAEPFERALADLGVAADRAVFVGNSLESDVAGARGVGLTSVWLRAPGAPDDRRADPDHVVDTLSALIDRPWAPPA